MNEQITNFTGLQPLFDKYANKLSDLFKELLEQQQIKFQAIEFRGKSITSFTDKVKREGKNYNDPIKEITDLAGVRIILYYLDDIDRIIEILNQEFEIDDKNSVDKKEELQFDQFGYLSIHKVISLRPNRSELPEWKIYSDFKCEIQIRTLLQHTWASISHTLQYKNEADIPHEIRRELHRLSGLLELADEEFFKIKNKRLKISSNIETALINKNLNIKVNLDSLLQFSKISGEYEKIALIGFNSGYKRWDFNDDEYGFTLDDKIDRRNRNLSLLIKVCEHLEIKTLEELKKELVDITPLIENNFKTYLDKIDEPDLIKRASSDYINVEAIILANKNKFSIEKLKEITDWNEKHISDLIE